MTDKQQNTDQESNSQRNSQMEPAESTTAVQDSATTTGEKQPLEKKEDAEDNAPIEVLTKQEIKNEQNSGQIDSGSLNPEAADITAAKKKQLKLNVVKMYKQVMLGCQKDRCMSKYCAKNPFSKAFLAQSKGRNIECLTFITKLLVSNPSIKTDGPFFCKENAASVNSENINSLSKDDVIKQFKDPFAFGSSFIPVNSACDDPFSACSVDLECFNAFLSKTKELAETEAEQASYMITHIEFLLEAIRNCYDAIERASSLKPSPAKSPASADISRNIFMDLSSGMVHYSPDQSPLKNGSRSKIPEVTSCKLAQLSYLQLSMSVVRCLTLVLMIPEISNFANKETFELVIQLFFEANRFLRNLPKTAPGLLEESSSFQSSELIRAMVPKQQLLTIVHSFNSYITIMIMENIFKQEQIQFTIEVLELFYFANTSPNRKGDEQIPNSEFYNDALNKDINLKKQADIFYKAWGAAKGKGVEFDKYSFFSLYNYPWTLNAHKKAELFRVQSTHRMNEHIQNALLENIGDLFNPLAGNQNLNRAIGQMHLSITVSRHRILHDALSQLETKAARENINRPLRVTFRGEPAIDEGGVQKEFFQLVIRELFNPDYALFTQNPDNRQHWFNGYTFESTMKFGLAGKIMGLAPVNMVIINIPILPLCYKFLLGGKADMSDLEQWQPEVATSFRYILNYDEEEPLENVLQRTFTIDMQRYDEPLTEELKEDGANIFVTKENWKEFVDLYIDYLFHKQCASQLQAFKEGFFSVLDEKLLKTLYSFEELEHFVCGSKVLDFKELQRVTKYARPLKSTHEIAIWFWDIVLNTFNDDQRRKLLAFTTGSDRIPITGFQDVEFILGIEGEDENKLPVAHTCFNQLLMPEYKTKEKMEAKLTQAIENCEGFGIV